MYAIRYVRAALQADQLAAPDKSQAGTDYDALDALYQAHKEAGVAGARAAWGALKKFVPHLDQKPRLYKADDLIHLVVPRYALDTGYAIYGVGFNVLVGARGAGKSFIALDIAARIALANPERAVVYTAGEGLPSYTVRWEAWKQYHGLAPQNLHFWDGAVQALNPESYAMFSSEIVELRPTFIVVDTVARAMTGQNENDTTVMGQFVQAIDSMMKEFECGVLLVHHEGRNGVMRGSSSLDGAADSVLVLRRDDRQILLINDFTNGGKNKHQEEAPTLYFDLIPQTVSIQGESVSGAVIVPSEKADESAADDAPLKGKEAALYEIIESHDGITTQDLTKTSDMPQASVYRMTKRLQARGKIHQNKMRQWLIGQTED